MDINKNIIRDPWLADILKRDVYKIIFNDIFVKEIRNKKIRNQLEDLCKRPVFIYAKMPVMALGNIAFLQEMGFYLVDTNLVFEKLVSPSSNFISCCELRFALPEDKSQVEALAKNSFVFSRFHLDEHFSTDVANLIKVEWVNSFFKAKRGNAMVVTLIDGVIVGFLLLLQDNNGLLTIDLIAVDSKYRRKGIASDMITYVQNSCKNVKKIQVGTQLANTPSIRCYEKLGFKLCKADYLLHYYNI